MVLAHGIVQSEIGTGHITRLKNLDLSSYTLMSGKYTKVDISATLTQLSNQEEPTLVFEGFPFDRHDWIECDIESQLQYCREEGKSIICSIRDIVIPWAPEAEKRIQQTIYYLNEYFDLVLVHSDPNFCKLEDSFPHTDLIDVPIEYTGYVSQSWDYELEKRRGTIVAAGGGIVDKEVFNYALKDTTLPRPLTFCIGQKSKYDLDKLILDHNIVIGLTTKDFRELISEAQIVVSQCGYNTFTDVIATKSPVHWLPYVDKDGTGDQSKRVELWNTRSIRNINLNGIENTAKILSNFT